MPFEHPDRFRFRELIRDTLMFWPDMDERGDFYKWGGVTLEDGADCSGKLIAIRRKLFGPTTRISSQSMYNECVREMRPRTRMLGCLYFYGSSSTNITHVTLGYDDLVAVGANNGTPGTNTRAEAKARHAGWQFCDPEYRSDLRAVYVPDWWPWVRVTTANLNVRDQPSIVVGQVRTTLDTNTAVELVSDEQYDADNYRWVRVVIDGEAGWVASEFLKR